MRSSTSFSAAGIPCFLDDKRSIMENAMVEMIRSLLEVVQKDFSYESVFRYVKTGLVSTEREKTDRLENYVKALGIRGFKMEPGMGIGNTVAANS